MCTAFILVMRTIMFGSTFVLAGQIRLRPGVASSWKFESRVR